MGILSRLRGKDNRDKKKEQHDNHEERLTALESLSKSQAKRLVRLEVETGIFKPLPEILKEAMHGTASRHDH